MTFSDCVNALTVNPAGDLFAGTGAGVYRSGNNGNSWMAVNSGLTHPRVSALAVDPAERLYAGTEGGGVFRTVR
jgi:ligand-binding sensor domain-containing protein